MTTKDTNSSKGLTYEEILGALPHRAPFLMVDKVLEIDIPGKKIVAQKNVSFNEPYFQGHFPNNPIMPGVMQIEALAQAGGIYVRRAGINGLMVLIGVKNARFRRIVRPGDILHMEVTSPHINKRGGRLIGKATVNGELACEVELICGFVPE